MFINEINSLCSYKSNYINFNKKQEENKKDKTEERILATTGVIAASVISGVLLHRLHIVSKKPPRKAFEDLLKEKGLELKNGIMLDKNNNKFTGELCRSTGKKGCTGHEMIETRRFKDGLITEKTYKDCFDNELSGKFYENGVLRTEISICAGKKMRPFSITKYDKDGNFCALGDGLAKGKESIFEKYRKIESNLN